MSKTVTNTGTTTVMMCIGAPLPAEIAAILQQMKRPSIGGIKWTDSKHWFIGFQNFFKMRHDLNLEKFKQSVKNNIFYKYFPLIVESKEMVLSPSVQLPKTLEWKLNIASAKDKRLDLSKMIEAMKVDMRETVKEACFSYQSIECEPSLILARIPESEKANPNISSLRDLKPYRDKFYLNQMLITKVTKDDKGVNYEFIEIKE